ncbi:hypothetical protein Bccel_5782 [Pseudobacteroides cellulosolvens ATCC 35603 = DSM 2933]|uniref:Uncharacterized protein n=2 Tax=Pseudobacteroides cellulosolvens TaxID=35825 RepID=A0A0L6JYG3_9FIRM|nr:hypothetical protein Bccel_5782 [Pseudobacteroides cellulosolvens ATCC 35603 = DSM 2933]
MPKMQEKADAVMGGPGVPAGTYREPVHKLRAKLIQCNNCGLIKQLSDENWNDYELWYKTKLKGHSLWAVNEEVLDYMIEWFSQKILKPYDEFERSVVETYPKWMITNKDKTLKKLIKLKQNIT